MKRWWYQKEEEMKAKGKERKWEVMNEAKKKGLIEGRKEGREKYKAKKKRRREIRK